MSVLVFYIRTYDTPKVAIVTISPQSLLTDALHSQPLILWLTHAAKLSVKLTSELTYNGESATEYLRTVVN